MKKYYEAAGLAAVTTTVAYLTNLVLGWVGPEGLFVALGLGVAVGALYLGIRYLITFVRMAHTSHSTLVTATKVIENQAKQIETLAKNLTRVTELLEKTSTLTSDLGKEPANRTAAINQIGERIQNLQKELKAGIQAEVTERADAVNHLKTQLHNLEERINKPREKRGAGGLMSLAKALDVPIPTDVPYRSIADMGNPDPSYLGLIGAAKKKSESR